MAVVLTQGTDRAAGPLQTDAGDSIVRLCLKEVWGLFWGEGHDLQCWSESQVIKTLILAFLSNRQNIKMEMLSPSLAISYFGGLVCAAYLWVHVLCTRQKQKNFPAVALRTS